MPLPHIPNKNLTSQKWRDGNKKNILSRLFSRKKKDGHLPVSSARVKKRWGRKLVGLFLLLGLFVIIVGGIIGTVTVAVLSQQLPDPNKLIDRQVAQSTKIYDREGKTVLYEIHGDTNRTLVNLSDIPDNLKWATISVEDKDYYNHGGFSVWAIFRTAVTNVLFGRKAGASTLTQQFIKNAVLTNEKTYIRKIKELIMAYKLEQKFTKDEILKMYFNEIPYGATAYGAEAASQLYFNKNVQDINLAEAAVLAALPQAPTYYSPYGSSKDALIARQQYILDLMFKYGHITKEQMDAAKVYPLKFALPNENIIAPHFVMYIRQILADKYGEKTIEEGGLKIYTTLDLSKQKIAEDVITGKAAINEKKYGATNAALISLDPKTGQILAMVGSRDYFDDKIDGQYNVTTASRQPGSSIKPIIYADAFLKGYTPSTMLYDVVTNFSNDPSKPYEPHNYDGNEHGLVSMRQALAGSLNIPAVKTLYLAGEKDVIDLADELGYTTLSDDGRYGLALVLGGGEVKLIEHANAFSAFARDGDLPKVTGILKVEDKDGKILEEYKDETKRALSPNVARMINNILSDNNARSFIFGAKNYLTLPDRPVATKTGTTNDYHDAWTIGYTPSIVTGVWAGNSDNSAMKKGADGSQVAAPIWQAYMQKVLTGTPIETFTAPDLAPTGKLILDGQTADGQKASEVKVKIDKASGLLATEYTPESFIKEKTFHEAHCILYYIDKDNPRGDAPADPAKDPQFAMWERGVQDYATKQGWASSTPPTESDNVHKPENRPSFTITGLTDGQIITDPNLTAQIQATAPRGINRAEYYINDNLFYVNKSFPFDLNKNASVISLGQHDLNVRVCDDIDNCSEQKLSLNFRIEGAGQGGEISLTWIKPAKDVTLVNKDFPFSFKTKIIQQGQLAKIVFYSLAKGSSTPEIIKTFAPVEQDQLEAIWQNIPASGIYKIYVAGYGWNQESVKSREITVIMKNAAPR
jgi:1A family penicillin-binding protein